MFKKVIFFIFILSSNCFALNLANNFVAISTSTGYVGIGTTSPAAKLDILGTECLRIRTDTATQGYMTFYSTSTSTSDRRGYIGTYAGGNDIVLNADGTNNIYLQTAANIRACINTSGNVGIGTIAPLRNFHINNSGTSKLTISENETTSMLPFAHHHRIILDATGSNSYRSVLTIAGTSNTAADNMQGIDLLNVTSAGGFDRWVIGRQGPQGYFAIGYSTNTGNYDNCIGGSPGPDLVILANGNVGIGTNAPAKKLDVRGSGVKNVVVSISIANDGAAGTGVTTSDYGLLIVNDNGETGGAIGIYRIADTGAVLISGSAFTTTYNNAGTYNLYQSGSSWAIQNKSGSSSVVNSAFYGL